MASGAYRETDETIGMFFLSVGRPQNGMKAFAKANALKLIEEAVELDEAAGATSSEIFGAFEGKFLRLKERNYEHPAVFKEVGDCRVVLSNVCHAAEIDGDEARDRVMILNRSRDWGVPDRDGRVQHKEGTP